MKYLSAFFFITIFSCSPFLNKEKFEELSISKNKILFTKPDSISFAKESVRVSKFLDSCRDNKLNCYYDNETRLATFPGGANMFRQNLYYNLKIKKFEKPADIKVKIIIEKKIISKMSKFPVLRMKILRMKLLEFQNCLS